MKKTALRRLSALFATAVMAVSCSTMRLSAQAGTASITLTDATAVAGKFVTVDLTINTGNLCAGYNVDVVFDSDLELKKVEGVVSTCQIDNVVTLVNFTGTYFKDDKVLSTLTFEVPEDAEKGEKFDVRIQKIGNFCTDSCEFENVVINNSTIEVLEGAKEVTNHMVYVEEGNTTSTEVALRGDVNGDGNVDLYDAILVTKKMMSIENFNKKQDFFANVNEDTAVDLYDAIGICRYGMASDKENAWGEIISK